MRASEQLAAAQTELVRALGREAVAPAGFDGSRLELMSEILTGKRRRSVAAACPGVPRALGRRFAPLFREYARAVPLRSTRFAASDACRFLVWLRDRGAAPRGIHVATLSIGRGRGLVIAWVSAERRLLLG